MIAIGRRAWTAGLLIAVVCVALVVPGRAHAVSSSSLTGTIDVASGRVSIRGTTDAGALVAINGHQFRASAAGAFSGSAPLAGTVTIAVAGSSWSGFSILLNLPVLPSAAVHVLPVMTFTYDGTSRTLGLSGKLIRKPAGAVRGYLSDTEARASVSFAVSKDNRFSTTVRLGMGLNTLHAYVRYLLVMRYTLPDFTISVGPAPRIIISLGIGSPLMTVNGSVKTIDAQGTKPLIIKGTTMVPIRAIVESLGGTVGWDTPTRRLDIRLGSRSITVWVGRTTATVNGSSTTISMAPAVIGGRTVVPLRFIAESLGCLVGWDQLTRGVTVVYGG